MPVSVRPSAGPRAAAATVRSLAGRLHRAAASPSLASALPVLRRLLATRVFREISLPQLCRRRDIVQRKHVLRMLAVEAGFAGWEPYSAALKTLVEDDLVHFEAHRDKADDLNLWFSSRADAERHASGSGGRVVDVGGQAVLLPRAAAGVADATRVSPGSAR